MVSEENKTSYNNWSIEKGDYIRKGLSEEHRLYSSRSNKLSMAVIGILFILVIVLAGMLFLRHGMNA